MFKVCYNYKDFIDNYKKQILLFKENYPDSTLEDFFFEYSIFLSQCIDNVSLHSWKENEMIFVSSWSNNEIKEIQDYIQDDQKLIQNLYYSFKKMQSKLSEMEYKGEKETYSKIKKLNWQGTQTEFMELIKALIENGTLKGTQKEIIKHASKFFNIEIKNPDKLITDIKKRNIGSETLYIDKLRTSLYNYITKENRR